jgi:iron complex outermembrane receptor protein
VGVVLAPGRLGPFDRLYLEAATFASRPRDLIVLLPTSGLVTRARNLGDVRLAGHELFGSARAFRTVTLTGNYTFLDSAQDSELISFDGRRVPGRPRHELYLRLDVARPWRGIGLGGWADVTAMSGNYLDAGNTQALPPRRLAGLGLRVTPRPGLHAALEVKNLFDKTLEAAPHPRAVSDVLGYPLPGRAFYATVEWSF